MTEPTHTPLPCPWKVGDKVQRKPGASYLFPGIIISTGLKLDGKTWHCEVECIAPGVEGCTHVFPASQLVPLDPAWNTRANADARLVEVIGILEGALKQIAESHWERFGLDQTDVEEVPSLSGDEAMKVARTALMDAAEHPRAALSEVSQ